MLWDHLSDSRDTEHNGWIPGAAGTLSWVPEDRWFFGSRGVDASTPMPRGKDWAHERRVVRCFPITDGQLSRSPPRMLPVDPAGVDPLPKMPGMGVKDGSISPQGAG